MNPPTPPEPLINPTPNGLAPSNSSTATTVAAGITVVFIWTIGIIQASIKNPAIAQAMEITPIMAGVLTGAVAAGVGYFFKGGRASHNI